MEMEADSTTYDRNSKSACRELTLPFHINPSNYKLYKDFSSNFGEKGFESLIVGRLQQFGLLLKCVVCPTGEKQCRVVCKAARVIDRVQWCCEGCGKRQPIRTGSFFLRLPCSLLQGLQMILAWCEDADYDEAAQHFGVKPRVASCIYDKLDEIAIKEQSKTLLGGEGSVVLAEMYPDCLTRLSPDTTDQPHVHRILMVADTKHIPTRYQLHVFKEDSKKNAQNSELLKAQVEGVISKVTHDNTLLVMGTNVPVIDGASTIQQLVEHCDADMHHFLTSRIWRQVITLCAASRELCAGAATAACAHTVQRYFHAALYRLHQADGFYERTLECIAKEFTIPKSPAMKHQM